MEKKLQNEILQWLRANQVYCIKTSPGAGTPVGCPDIIGLYRDRFLALEVKATNKASNRPLQLHTLRRLGEHNEFVFRVSPENWPEVKLQIQKDFF